MSVSNYKQIDLISQPRCLSSPLPLALNSMSCYPYSQSPTPFSVSFPPMCASPSSSSHFSFNSSQYVQLPMNNTSSPLSATRAYTVHSSCPRSPTIDCISPLSSTTCSPQMQKMHSHTFIRQLYSAPSCSFTTIPHHFQCQNKQRRHSASPVYFNRLQHCEIITPDQTVIKIVSRAIVESDYFFPSIAKNNHLSHTQNYSCTTKAADDLLSKETNEEEEEKVIVGNLLKKDKSVNDDCIKTEAFRVYVTNICKNINTKKDVHKVLDKDSIPIKVMKCEYAVRGRIVTRSMEIEKIIKENPNAYPFKELCFANIGNPLAVGQKNLTFNRQVLSCLIYPALMSVENFAYPFDVIKRAQTFLQAISNIGAYSHSSGIEYFRRECAKWLEYRDGYKCDYETIFLSDGASTSVRTTLELLIRDENDGVMIPVPQYPLYSASITRLGGTAVPYYLSEDDGWSLQLSELLESLKKARNQGKNVRALVVINPGNPTGAVLNKTEMQHIVNFCETEQLVLLADEVYQENIYGDKPFISFRKMVCEMNSKLELISFHSSSKGITGECGIRGGLLQAQNLHSVALDNLYKLFSISLCANTIGQAMMVCTVTPPKEGEPSFPLYKKQKDDILGSLKRKAKLVCSYLNGMQGVSCQPIEGAMYAFPAISLPLRAMKVAEEKNMAGDLFYCMELLEHTGVVVVPGSGFGQKEGSWHYRITILPEENKIKTIMAQLHKFHDQFMKKYA